MSLGTLHAEAGLISDRSIGRSRLLRANTSGRTARALTELLMLTFGPQIVIEEEFRDLADVDQVVVYGSWARRHNGEMGREPADFDVMVVGSPQRDAVYAAAERSEQRLGMPVNPTVRSARHGERSQTRWWPLPRTGQISSSPRRGMRRREPLVDRHGQIDDLLAAKKLTRLVGADAGVAGHMSRARQQLESARLLLGRDPVGFEDFADDDEAAAAISTPESSGRLCARERGPVQPAATVVASRTSDLGALRRESKMPVQEVPNGLWARKHDMPGTPVHVPVIAYPTGLADLIELCKRSDGTKFKAAGSHWALSTAAMSDHTHIETHDPDDLHEAMDRTLYDVVPRGLSGPFVDHLVSRTQPAFGNEAAWSPLFRDESSCFVHVEAGKRIYQLYGELDNNDAPEGLSAFLEPKNSSYKGPWAFRTLGGAGGQTVVGALTTGTHGGDFHGPPLADDVVAIHLVVDGGRHYWIEPDPDPDMPQMVDDETLHKLYGAQKYPEGSFEVVRSNRLFNAVLVSAGRFGVIYSVVLRAVRQYCLHEDRHLTTWEEIRDDVGNYSSKLYRTSDTDPNHFLQIAVSVTKGPNGRKERRGDPGPPPPGSVIHGPFFDQAGRSIAYSPDPDKPNAALPMSMLELACMDGEFLIGIIESVIEEIRKLVDENQVVSGSAAAAIVVTGSGAELLLLAAPLLALLALLITYLAARAAEGGVHRNGQVLNEVKDVLLDHDDPGMQAAGLFIWQAISYKVFKGRQEDQNYTAISYAVMDQHNYLDQSCEVNVDSIEVFFEANDPMLLAFVDALLAYEIRQERQGKAFAGYISLRFTGPTRALIGEQRWPTSCAVEVAGLKDVTGVTELIDFAIATSRDRNYGGILHWGQRNESNRADIEHRFGDGATPAGGDIGTWREELGKLTHGGQRDAFSSNFTRQVGLEVT